MAHLLVQPQKLNGLTVGRCHMAADPLEHHWHLCGDPIQIITARHPLFPNKQVLVPALSCDPLLCRFRILADELLYALHHLIHRAHSRDGCRGKVHAHVQKVHIAVIDPRDHRAALQVNDLCTVQSIPGTIPFSRCRKDLFLRPHSLDHSVLRIKRLGKPSSLHIDLSIP